MNPQRRAHFIALLRGINVGGHNMIPMRELKAQCDALGWRDVQSYIQSGNLVFTATGAPAGLEQELERSIEVRFGLSVPVIIRQAEDWFACVRGNPFPEASESEPERVLVGFPKTPPKPGAAEGLRARAVPGEQIVQTAHALWIHYCHGVAKSKLTSALLDRWAGSTVTARNWNTVLKLEELVRQLEGVRPTP